MESGDSPLPDDRAAERIGEDREWAWLARIRRPQGRKGEVFAEILTDFPEKFAERHQLWLLKQSAAANARGSRESTAPVTLTHHWLHKGGVVLQFAGIDSISAAEELAGMIVAIPRAERVALAEDEAYVGDLIGCTVFDVASGSPVEIGAIEDVDRTAGPVPLLVVSGIRDEILIPFAKSYLRKIDVHGRRVEMDLPVGLVNLDEADEA
jgi:16S rRNA processing protein RimM